MIKLSKNAMNICTLLHIPMTVISHQSYDIKNNGFSEEWFTTLKISADIDELNYRTRNYLFSVKYTLSKLR